MGFVILFGLIVAVLAAMVLVVMPIMFMVGGFQLAITGVASDTALGNVGAGGIGVLFAYTIGLPMLFCVFENKKIKASILGVLGVILAAIAAASICAINGLVVAGGILVVIIGFLSLVSIIFSVIAKIIWG